MEYIKRITHGKYFTAGNLYPIIDGSISTGIITYDDDNTEHYLSPEYIQENFWNYSESFPQNLIRIEEV